MNITRYNEECGATRILFYSICAVVPVFITGIRIKETSAPFSISTLTFPAEKSAFFLVAIYKIGKKLSP